MPTMTPNPSKEPPPLYPSDPHAQARFIVSHVRMTITQKEGVQTLAVPATVHKILTSIRAVDNKTVFTDVQKQPFTLENFPSDKATFDTAFGTVIKDGRSTKVIIGFTITSANTFGKLKQAIMPVLQRCNTFMRPHLSTSWTRLDAITIGHLHLIHPTFADVDDLRSKMIYQLTETADRIQDRPEYHERLSEFISPDGKFTVPEIMFYPGRALGKMKSETVASDVIDIYIARESAQAINFLLEASSENKTRPLAVVPRDFKYNQPDTYAKLLSAQNNYLEQHRNIGLVAIPDDAMNHQKVKDIDGKEWKSMCDALRQAPGVAAVHRSKRIFDLGKWNISTKHDSWEDVKQWLDKHLLPLYNSIPANQRAHYKSYDDFTGPQRLQYKPPQTRNPSDASVISDYAQRIQNQMLGNLTVPMATQHKPPAWKSKRPKLVWTFNEDDFPPIATPISHKTIHDDISTGSQPSTTTTNSMTTISTGDESIRKLQAQWKKQKADLESNFQTKLTTLDSTVKILVTQLDSLDTRIDNKMSAMETKLIAVIGEKLAVSSLVAKVSAVMGGETSPYVTSASLDLTMTKWFAKVNNRLDGLVHPTGDSEQPRPHKKRQSVAHADVTMPTIDVDADAHDHMDKMDSMDEESDNPAELHSEQPAHTN
jgi:hypothetical protein